MIGNRRTIKISGKNFAQEFWLEPKKNLMIQSYSLSHPLLLSLYVCVCVCLLNLFLPPSVLSHSSGYNSDFFSLLLFLPLPLPVSTISLSHTLASSVCLCSHTHAFSLSFNLTIVPSLFVCFFLLLKIFMIFCALSLKLFVFTSHSSWLFLYHVLAQTHSQIHSHTHTQTQTHTHTPNWHMDTLHSVSTHFEPEINSKIIFVSRQIGISSDRTQSEFPQSRMLEPSRRWFFHQPFRYKRNKPGARLLEDDVGSEDDRFILTWATSLVAPLGVH